MNNSHALIPFNLPTPVDIVIGDTLVAGLGKGHFKKACESILSTTEGTKVLLTPSCSAALEMSALSINIQPGDEVILPSFTFVTSASAFALRGAKLVFVDIRPDTLNIDENLIEAAITLRTKAIVVVHYAGVACEMDKIKAIAKTHGLALVEDAAQGVGAYYNGMPLGTIGDYGCYSFHYTKNIHAGGEGGALVVRDADVIHRVEILQEKGTDRSRFLRGEVDKYTWQELSSSYVMAEIQGVVLFHQLQRIKEITANRLQKWQYYYSEFLNSQQSELCQLPTVPAECNHNAHIFFMILPTAAIRDNLLQYLKSKNIEATTHYVPLHSSPAGQRYSRFHGNDRYTTDSANRILRLPLYDQLSTVEQQYIIEHVKSFFALYCLKSRLSA